MSNYNDLSSIEKDFLKELGNIGAGNAATALSKMINKKIDMEIPKVNFMPFNDIINVVGGPDKVVVGVFLRVSGEVEGNILFIISKDNVFHLLDLLFNKSKGETSDIGAMEESALLEIGNILTSSYLGALSDLTNMKFNPSVPDMSIDMAGAILSVPLTQFGLMGDTALLIETQLLEGDYKIRGNYFFIPDPDSFDKLLTVFGGKKMNDIIKVGMAELKITKSPSVLTTIGLGSCVGIIIYDNNSKIGGLAHIMLPDSSKVKNNNNPAKFADTAISILVDEIVKAGGSRKKLVSKIAGGAQMFSFKGKTDLMKIGERNSEAAKENLIKHNIKLISKDVGGNHGRTIEFYTENGDLLVKTIGHGEQLI